MSDTPLFDETFEGYRPQPKPSPYPKYVYTDPVVDDAFPGITSAVNVEAPDRFPEGWGEHFTERDMAGVHR